MLNEGDSGPEVRFYFQPEGLGVCETAFSWGELPEDEAERMFRELDENKAMAHRDRLCKQFSEDFSNG
jgi:hypothetical protein